MAGGGYRQLVLGMTAVHMRINTRARVMRGTTGDGGGFPMTAGDGRLQTIVKSK